jgi:predicted nucleic acid-binding protein
MVDKFVIDTNVAISANGINTHASITCQLACIELLEQCKKLHVAIDKSGLILDEYAKHLSHAGQPGVGDMFFKYLHDNQYDSKKKIHSIAITLSDNVGRGFDELPFNSLDPSDRKFLATAVVAQAMIVNATDSDWLEQRELLENLQIELKQLCPEHCCKVDN